MNSSFFNSSELENIGLKKYGKNVMISRYVRIYNPEVITIGNNVRIDDYCVLSGGKYIEIGNYVHIAAHSGIWGSSGLTLGNYCGTSSGVKIYTSSEDYSGEHITGPILTNKENTKRDNQKVVMKDYTIIGANSVILPGTTLEEGVAIGCNSFIKGPTESWKIYAGCPAKIIKNRNTSGVKKIESLL